ncbi:MAG: Asp-tRNA(Asn)/Glu-tRNA(Gln) amidotransferase subunit GatB [Alphaproteobacteria bacterium]|jgi:aspartyl-tRNA(Asn)/glutamyl-tRNA(Gln) amidotransferase subunit B|nr:Asp-tRNA(Asn)/Glu-tRNA(Gln) amidotransferase subunit GatB [Alphaproteobacteria bacterium]MDP6237842.1 Asp-tRNA(Asn)/Glu-tRNA(Gln) amidotransferase subunit GatB [Alphaproteobacteria bacterium]MDP7173455.1 Asp-tRNA(Asn)/Glu-tRNA(Gln) amidotransferase subunit GatB [Alphaproteobacteria bacterium]MDP7233582.1 Asp-tRNA(Asn)/Glu-tRNA(Gln) amidotransferase subunit GatB [Alphaproteobacteria bacterium]MDP7486996.1 Asp-tRNA(Asn)/Glu-tRNA(Gln) amidotransferase subunit GatB [Alphaproteobacteria bacterium|tara:strand:+ start:12906 stop:14351 length:1446 start_codon:yes stop_codon:yes gene_type:complete
MMEGRTGEWELVIGLEVHAQVVSGSKLFSGAAAAFGGEPNSQVSLVDAAMPGMLPVINDHVVDQAVRTGLALGAEIHRVSIFDRKNYFYPDLPQGYQISQFSRPIVGHGEIGIDMKDSSERCIGITRLHLEQDAGKSIHDRHPNSTCVDLNRSGVPLMEIVSEPDMRSAEEAGLYVTKLRAILRSIGTCDGNMEEGSLRADANVSVRRPGDELGTRCEIKNLNSIRFLRRAIEIEAARQIAILEDGGTITQETRLFDPDRDETRSMRSKEDAHDYRYFPDPDLLPLVLSEERVARLAAELPELPDARKARFMADYGLAPDDAVMLVADGERADFFEAVAAGRDARLAANWIRVELGRALNASGQDIADSKITPDTLGGLLDLVAAETISGSIAKRVFEIMFESGRDAAEIVAAEGLEQVSDTGVIEAEVDKVLTANPGQVAEFRAGKEKLMGFFVGQVMKATKGKANPGTVNEILRRKLSE